MANGKNGKGLKPQPFDEAYLNKCVQKIRGYNDRKAKCLEKNAPRIRELEEELVKLRVQDSKNCGGYDDEIANVTTLIEEVARPEMEATDSKSLKLIGGELKLRQKPDSIKIVNEKEAIEFCKENDIEVRVKESIDKKAVKEILYNGQQVAGCEIVKGAVDFIIKLT